MKRNLTVLTIGVLLLLVSGTFCISAEPSPSPESTNKNKNGVGYFQLAPAIALEAFSDAYVKEAKINGDNKIVRITDSYDYTASIWMMGQYVFQDWARSGKNKYDNFAPGIYMAAKVISEDSKLFDGASIGVSLVWFRNGLWAGINKNKESAETQKRVSTETQEEKNDTARDEKLWFQTINISAGPAWHRTRTLGQGTVAGQPLPSDYSSIEYKDEDEISWVIMVSGSI